MQGYYHNYFVSIRAESISMLRKYTCILPFLYQIHTHLIETYPHRKHWFYIVFLKTILHWMTIKLQLVVYLKLEMLTHRIVVIYKSTSIRTGWTMLKVKSFYNQAVRTLGGLGLSNRPLDVSKTGRSLLQLRPLVALDVLEAPPENIWRTRNNFI